MTCIIISMSSISKHKYGYRDMLSMKPAIYKNNACTVKQVNLLVIHCMLKSEQAQNVCDLAYIRFLIIGVCRQVVLVCLWYFFILHVTLTRTIFFVCGLHGYKETMYSFDKKCLFKTWLGDWLFCARTVFFFFLHWRKILRRHWSWLNLS